ncbi:hypothetical protein [Streptomyces tendae]|uniref:hypothetical protein n=1 Tax=Streptomyces tendae TaxID=1932 RepID=UPI0036ABEBCA
MRPSPLVIAGGALPAHAGAMLGGADGVTWQTLAWDAAGLFAGARAFKGLKMAKHGKGLMKAGSALKATGQANARAGEALRMGQGFAASLGKAGRNIFKQSPWKNLKGIGDGMRNSVKGFRQTNLGYRQIGQGERQIAAGRNMIARGNTMDACSAPADLPGAAGLLRVHHDRDTVGLPPRLLQRAPRAHRTDHRPRGTDPAHGGGRTPDCSSSRRYVARRRRMTNLEAVSTRINATAIPAATRSPVACSSPFTSRKSRNTTGMPMSHGRIRCRPSAP